jgi:cytochrome b561
MTNGERFFAKAAHWASYLLMVVVPLSGWTYASSQWADGKPLNVPTLWFGLFPVPHLFDARAMTDAARAAVAERNAAAHCPKNDGGNLCSGKICLRCSVASRRDKAEPFRLI